MTVLNTDLSMLKSMREQAAVMREYGWRERAIDATKVADRFAELIGYNKMKLSDRVRPGSEVAQWVYEEIVKLELSLNEAERRVSQCESF